MPRIVFKQNEHAPVDLTEAVTVGRSASHANVVIRDNRLSRAHCRFEPRDDGWSVVDLESQNGTFLNGRRVREALVKPGDVVTIGTCDMLFEEVGGPGAESVMAGVDSTRQAAPDFADENIAAPTAEKAESTRTVVAPAALVLVKGTLPDRIHPITADPFLIGRKHDTQLCLQNDGKASGHHARIRRDGAAYVIEDLGSTNGVVVNGQKIEGPVVLKPGMKVLLGQQLFRFQLQGQDDVSSGQTAPSIAAADVQARLKPPGQTGDSADLDQPEPGQPATIMATPAEQAALNEVDDRAALSQHVKFKSAGGGIFALVEIIVVVAVAGAILFAAWTMLKDDGTTGGGGDGDYPPSRDGGLLANNPSFDDVDEGGYARGWNYVVSGTDSFNLVEGARGGRYAMQISRFGPANEASFVVSERMDAPEGGVKVSVFALNGEASADRYGSALVSVFWYAGKRDTTPMMVTPITARTRMADWVELAGNAAVPAGARQFSVALGMTGTQGSVAFDEVSVSAEPEAEDWFTPQSVAVPDGMQWQIDDRGDISLNGPEGVYLRGGRIVLFQALQRRDPLQVLEMLTAKPDVQRTDNNLYLKYRYFDPLAAQNLQLTLRLGSQDGRPALEASVQALEGTPDKAARYVTLHALATAAWAPAELVRFERPDAQPASYTAEIGMAHGPGAEFALLLSADTGTGNRIVANEGHQPAVTALRHTAGRELMITEPGSLSLGFARGQGRDELQEQVSLVAAVQPGEDQMDRVDRAVGIFRDYLYNQNETAAAAQAIDAAGKHYSLRLIELRDGINVPQLTRNEQLYRAAMEEAIASSDKLRAASDRWNRDAMPMLRLAAGDTMLPRTRESAALARDALRELIDLAESFEALARVARKSLFTLEVEIEQRESESYMVSARDFLDSGQYVQGMVKLRAVVANYPRCLRGIEAKERMVDVAAILLDEMDRFNRQDLRNIAGDRALQARELLDLVESRLLAGILSADEKNWLRDPDLPAELRSGEWISRENELARRITEMRQRLPGEGN